MPGQSIMKIHWRILTVDGLMQDAQRPLYKTLVVRQPVEFVQDWRDVVTHAQSSDDNESNIVLGILKITQHSSSLSNQQCIARIKCRHRQ